MMEFVKARTIIQRKKPDYGWFGADYNMNLYRGCCHGCIYCDSRCGCYRIEEFDRVRMKKDSGKILEQELKYRWKPGVVGIGAMSDTYNPFEAEYRATLEALEHIQKYGYGVSIDTKSDLIIRDKDLFLEIRKQAPVILKLTITTVDDDLSKIIEPYVCCSSKRFAAVRSLSDAGLFTGILFTPILPFLTDTEENVRLLVKKAHESGARFIFSMGGVTLRENQRDYYFEKLDRNFPGLKERYIQNYGRKYYCKPLNKNLIKLFRNECKSRGLLYKMEDIVAAYKREVYEQMSLFDF